MIISKLIPTESSLYLILSEFSKNWNGLMKFNPYRWFVLWILMASGTAAHEGVIDRFTFWNESSPLSGWITLVIVTGIFQYTMEKQKFSFNGIVNNWKLIIEHILFSFLLFITGWGWLSGNYFNALQSFLPYLMGYLSVLGMFQINLDTVDEKGYEPGKWIVVVSLLLSISSIVLGIILDDPVISTASAVYTPFLLVTLVFPEHKRHIQRIRIYPIFIYAMFVSVRLPWLLIPLGILFFGIRIYNYFRYNIVYPTFSVDHD